MLSRRKKEEEEEKCGGHIADEEDVWKENHAQQQQQQRRCSGVALGMLLVVMLVGGYELMVTRLEGQENRLFSWSAYSNNAEAAEDDSFRFGAVQLCSTRNVRRSSFDAYTVIPRHDIYYADADVQKWEWEDSKEYFSQAENGTTSSVGFSLSLRGKDNLKRYGNFGALLTLTIFEVELCSVARCPPDWHNGGLSILGILESHAKQEEGKKKKWTAFNSNIAARLGAEGNLDCLFHDAATGVVVHRTQALLESRAYGGLFLKIFCKPPHSVLSTSGRFGVSLAMSQGDAFAIHGPIFDVCRNEERRRRRRRRQHGSGIGNGSAICLRPLSLHKLFDSEYTIELEHLVAWVEFHVHLTGIRHIYLQDRWGEIGSRSQRLQELVDDGFVTLIGFPFFSQMLTDKHSSNMRYLSTYDQTIAYEVCLMHSRQMGDEWLVPLDSDEWLRIGGGRESIGDAIDALLLSRNVTTEEVAEIQFLRFDMHSHESSEDTAAGFVPDETLLPIEAYRFRNRAFHPKPRSTLNPYNAGVMNIHENVPLQQTELLPWPPNGVAVALLEEPLAFVSIAHFVCSQVLKWPNGQWCPCPPSAECVPDAHFATSRSELEKY